MESKQGCPDVETLAELVDGRLRGPDRERVVAHLSSCAGCREVFASAAELGDVGGLGGRAGAETGSAAGPRPDAGTLSRPGPISGHWAKVAAALLVAVGLGALLWAAGAYFRDGTLPPAATLLGDAGAAAALQPGWDLHGWSVDRGAGDDGPARAAEFRLGVRLVDLEVALSAGRPADPAVAGIRRALERLGPTDHLRRAYTDALAAPEIPARPGSPERFLDEARDLERRVRAEIDSDWLELGRWAEAARLRARSGGLTDAGPPFDGVPRRFLALPAADPVDRILRELDAALRARANAGTVRRLLDALITEAGG